MYAATSRRIVSHLQHFLAGHLITLLSILLFVLLASPVSFAVGEGGGEGGGISSGGDGFLLADYAKSAEAIESQDFKIDFHQLHKWKSLEELRNSELIQMMDRENNGVNESSSQKNTQLDLAKIKQIRGKERDHFCQEFSDHALLGLRMLFYPVGHAVDGIFIIENVGISSKQKAEFAEIKKSYLRAIEIAESLCSRSGTFVLSGEGLRDSYGIHVSALTHIPENKKEWKVVLSKDAWQFQEGRQSELCHHRYFQAQSHATEVHKKNVCHKLVNVALATHEILQHPEIQLESDYFYPFSHLLLAYYHYPVSYTHLTLPTNDRV